MNTSCCLIASEIVEIILTTKKCSGHDSHSGELCRIQILHNQSDVSEDFCSCHTFLGCQENLCRLEFGLELEMLDVVAMTVIVGNFAEFRFFIIKVTSQKTFAVVTLIRKNLNS